MDWHGRKDYKTDLETWRERREREEREREREERERGERERREREERERGREREGQGERRERGERERERERCNESYKYQIVIPLFKYVRVSSPCLCAIDVGAPNTTRYFSCALNNVIGSFGKSTS